MVTPRKTKKPVLGRNPFAGPESSASSPSANEAPPAKAKSSARSATSAKPNVGKVSASSKRPQKTTSEASKAVSSELQDVSASGLGREQIPAEQTAQTQRVVETVPLPQPAKTPKEEQNASSVEDAGGVKSEAEAREDYDVLRELQATQYFARQWSRLGMRRRFEAVDDFGQDPKFDDKWRAVLDWLFAHYFRVQVEGFENLPREGRGLVVANHSGVLPFDALMLKVAVRKELPSQRQLRWLVENHVFYMPFVGSVLNRLGAVRACQENAERLLGQGHLVAVFPEGQKGQGRLFRDRYQLQRFGRGGFVRLGLRTQTPIVPCAIVGPEEAMPLLYKLEEAGRIGGVPFLPITPTFPWFGPLGLLPAPTRWRLVLGPPILFDAYEPEAASDDVLVGRLTDRVRATIQAMVDRTLAGRRSIWVG